MNRPCLAPFNQLLLAGLAALALVASARATDAEFVNNNTIQAPPDPIPVIDATNFVNNALFLIDETLSSWDYPPYSMKNTRFYTNNGTLSSSSGFRLDLHTNADYTSTPSQYSTNAEVVYNASGAILNAGGTNLPGIYLNPLLGLGLFDLGPKLQIYANTVVNRGTMEVGQNGLLSMRGQNLDLAGGRIALEGDGGQWDGYWGIGDQKPWYPGGYFSDSFAMSPFHYVTNRNYLSTFGSVYVDAIPYQNQIFRNPSNVLNQVVYLQPPADPAISNAVYFIGTEAVVDWLWTSTNLITGEVTQESAELYDEFVSLNGNLSLRANSTAAPNTGYRPGYVPTNMFVFRGQGYAYGQPAVQGSGLVNFGFGSVSNSQFKAYQAIFLPTSDYIGEGAGQTYTNARGRIELTASKNLDLTGARVSSLNALILKATNNYSADRRTRLQTYAADFDLGVTNSLMTVSNLMAPTCPRLQGTIDVYSTHWTTVQAGITNEYHVVLIDSSSLTHAAPTIVQNLALHSQNVVISDVLNVVSNLTIDAESLTIATNGPGALSPAGAVNLLSGSVLWPSAFPRLKNLTNWGSIQVNSGAYFGAATNPYANFVNHGSVSTLGSTYVYANNFEHSGSMNIANSLLSIQAGTATLSNGWLSAPNLDVALSANTIFATNSYINAGHKLTLSATTSLDDGGDTASNFWVVGSGGVSLNLPTNRLYACLLGTTISNSLPTWGNAASQWPGRDLGRSASGFVNNAALGKLVLYGGDPDSQFTFQGPAPSGNALYVDCLELRGTAANFDGTSLVNLNIQPGMKIYYAQANIIVGTNNTPISVAEALDGMNNGALNWVSGYAGTFSTVTVTNPVDGLVYTMNAALRYSTSFNSRKSSTSQVNAYMQFPLFVPTEYNFLVQPTNNPARGIALSWQTIGYATNSVLYKNDLLDPNWLLLTNFVSPSVYGPPFTLQVLDQATSPCRIYRLRVDAQLP